MTPTKSFTERVFQALGFEGLALLICTPLLVWITGRPALEMGAVTLGISLLALSWNGLRRLRVPPAQTGLMVPA